MKKLFLLSAIVGLGLFVSPLSVYSEETTGKTEQELKAETNSLLDEAKKKFDPASIRRAKAKISSENYFSGIRQAVRFAAALSIYTDYERKLDMERARRIGECKRKPDGCDAKEKKRIIKEIELLRGNVLIDVDTFKYSLNNSLERCRDAAERFDINDEKAIYNYDPLEEEVLNFLENSKGYKTYLKNSMALLKSFRNEILMLANELGKWERPEPKRPGPRVPIVDKKESERL